MALSIEEYRPVASTGRKDERIAAILEPRYDNMLIFHYRGGNISLLEEELQSRNPPHDDVKDSVATAVDMAVKPASSRNRSAAQTNVIQLNNRFRRG